MFKKLNLKITTSKYMSVIMKRRRTPNSLKCFGNVCASNKNNKELRIKKQSNLEL